ncbi:MAG: 4-(cytidine 5'-diphospho)-2-C-methyl-D-erythritol kinase [Burkholderiaceae bacterium]
MNQLFLGLPAPAKLNLFLHVVGRRDDGYHLLQSAFQLVNLADSLDIEGRDDGEIVREGDLLGPAEADLCVRAARLLKAATGTPLGATIRVRKRIPAGAGMGGGSSDAATTLLALNRMWQLRLPREALAQLGLTLGADVPFFLFGSNAFVEGVGEIMRPLRLPARWFAVIWPGMHLATAEIFREPGLTRNSEPTTMSVFSAVAEESPTEIWGRNDLEIVARNKAPAVGQALDFLGRLGKPRMTGSGAAVFVALNSETEVKMAIQDLPTGWKGWALRSMDRHPMSSW